MTEENKINENTTAETEINEEAVTIDDIADEEVSNVEQFVPATDLAEKLATENAELKDKMLRLAAEMENLRRRTQKEKEDAGKYAVASLARELLSVADNMSRAVDHAPKEMDNEPEYVRNLFAGVHATHAELIKVMGKMGIHPVRTDGLFDPNLHEVLFEAPGTGQPAGTVIQVIEPGYMIHDRLLRPARVGVAAKEPGGNATVDVSA